MRTHGHREGSITHWDLLGGNRGGTAGVGGWGEIAQGEIPHIGEGEEGSKSHCHACTYAAILHVLPMYPKTKCNNKKRERENETILANMVKPHLY